MPKDSTTRMMPASPEAAVPTTTSDNVSASVTPQSPRAAHLKFTGGDRFLRELRRRVDAYFTETGLSRRDCPAMYLKTAIVLAVFAASYLALLLVVTHWWAVVPLAMLLGVATAAIGFNIQHDGGHRAYSERPWVNKIMALSLDLIGGSSYIWDWKHNAIHHTYTNIEGHDDDINVGIFGRLCPHQRRLKFHRFQGIYLWMLYGLLAIKWHLFDDFNNLIVGRIGGTKVPRPKGKNLAVFIAGKVVFFSMAFGVPMLLHPVWAVLATYALAAVTSGIVLSVVFQLAHCVEEADFPVPVASEGGSGAEEIRNAWAVHQVQTTVDFARGNRALCWFLGGLNFQVEHHLFNRICHVHYPALSKVVQQTCAEFGIRYSAHEKFWSAVGSHYRFLVAMGKAETN
jgi:linoleoyl-CoA desaturase